MAIEFARVHVLSRSSGHSAVKAAAYRSGERLVDERIGRVADYTPRANEVGHSEILLPEGADPAFGDRTTLWSAVERREDQHNRWATAQLAKDHIIALPRGLSQDQHIELARTFAEATFVSCGIPVDLNLHYHSDGNPHAHLLTPTRILDGAVLGRKAREMNGRFSKGQKLTDAEQLRHGWAAHQNAFFHAHGLDLSVTNHAGEYTAEVHRGPAHGMEQRGIETTIGAEHADRVSRRAKALLDEPTLVVDRVADRKSVFTRHDLYRELSTLVDDREVFNAIMAKLDVAPELVRFRDDDNREHLTTHRVLEDELTIRGFGSSLSKTSRAFELDGEFVGRILSRYPSLSDEQGRAVRHLTGSEQLSLLVGLAGAGKSTLLDAVRQIHTGHGHRVRGIALSGKAALELRQSAGIESSTIASWQGALRDGRETLEAGDVVVIDEAAMIGNRTMLPILERAQQAGAKLILVGDGEQLQSIRAGCPFRQLAEQTGYAEVETIRRQRETWQRDATWKLARGDANGALSAYAAHGSITTHGELGTSIDALAQDYVSDQRDGSRIVLAHRRRDVVALNAAIRDGLEASGRLGEGFGFGETEPPPTRSFVDVLPGDRVVFTETDAEIRVQRGQGGLYLGDAEGEHRVQLDDGRVIAYDRDIPIPLADPRVREEPEPVRYAEGDRIVFARNDAKLDVKNGSLGTITAFDGERMSVACDDGHDVDFDASEYDAIEHGYAISVHKAQGMTVDHARVLATGSMDRHVGYVALSRHRESLEVYEPSSEFRQRPLADVLSTARRQETVLDFAARYGLEHAALPDGSHRFESRIQHDDRAIETRDPSASQSASEALDTNEPLSLVEAKAQLEAAAQSEFAEALKRREAEIREVEQGVEAAQAALGAHDALQPRSGSFASKAKQRVWQDEQRTLERDANAKAHDLSRLRDWHTGTEGALLREIRERVAAQHSEAATVVREHNARVSALHQIERIEGLCERIEALQAESGRAATLTVDHLVRRLGLHVHQLARSPVLMRSLTADEQTRVRSAEHAVEAHEKARGLDDDRGMTRD